MKLNARLLQDKTAMSGFSRLMQIMTGQVPTIHTFGILSVDNPQGVVATPEQKKQLEFKNQLRRSFYGYVQHGGKYGEFEKAFFIMNCRKSVVLDWGSQYDQESVIFGTVDHESQEVTFEFIKHGVTIAVRKVVLSLTDDADSYSICKGRKFQIPFFEDIPTDEKLTRQEDEFTHDEANLPHLATLFALKDKIKGDAMGRTSGMALLLHRYAAQKALTALTQPKFPLSVFKTVSASSPSQIKRDDIGTDWTTAATKEASEDGWVLRAEVEEEDIEKEVGSIITLKKGTGIYLTATKQKADPRWSLVRLHGKV